MKVVVDAFDVIPAVNKFVVVTEFDAYTFPVTFKFVPVYDAFVAAPATPDDVRYTRFPAVPDGAGPVAPAGPVDPVAPVAPVDPVAPVAPVDPVAPVAPVDPVAPVAPVDPVAPVAPTKLMRPVSELPSP